MGKTDQIETASASQEELWAADHDYEGLQHTKWPELKTQTNTGDYLGLYSWEDPIRPPAHPLLGRYDSFEKAATNGMQDLDLVEAIAATELSEEEQRILFWRTPIGSNRFRYTLAEIATHTGLTSDKVIRIKERAYSKVLDTLLKNPHLVSDPVVREGHEHMVNSKINWERQVEAWDKEYERLIEV